ncbi:helix-turn-helix domain-containing protein [Frankia gtarii]|uniref:helix-turn-helix domain-containing protein n=1 Tax=Frankia gtarii TaxID=2950102 RepID=UPI0021C22629|nr:helix-turn-helix domain-containing protein [Frankia gtarii]
MKELAGRMQRLDPDAGAALQVISYFDRLVEGRAGLATVVRGAAVLAGCPARFVHAGYHLHIEVEPDGTRRPAGTAGTAVDPGWLGASLVSGGPRVLWLERCGPAGPVDAMVLERAMAAARVVLERTRGGPSEGFSGPGAAAADPALVEVVIDAAAPEQIRLRAARRLGLDETVAARALALADGPREVRARVEAVAGSAASRRPGDRRIGVGPAMAVLELPNSWAAARTALRLTADGTALDPGPRVVCADQMGGLAVLAAAIGPETPLDADVQALRAAGFVAPWAWSALEAMAASPSLRTAAAALTVHHSTLQDRLALAESALGWTVHDPQGRLRLQLAFAMHRLHRNPPS